MPIDFNRGVTSRRLPDNGPLIHMYKGEPGIYYDEGGELLSEEEGLRLAAAAKFPVEEHAKERRKRELLAEKQAEIEKRVEAEFSSTMAKAEKDVERQLEKAGKDERQPRSREEKPASTRSREGES